MTSATQLAPPPAFAFQRLETSQLCKVAALIVFACWTLTIGASHEPWGDEAQAWLLARDSALGELLFERVRYEGTPGLWHAILWLAIRGGVQYSQLYLISTFFAISGAAVVLWRAPFPLWMRVGVVFSYFYAFQFATIARSYSVDLLLIPLLAAFFATRSERPLRYALVTGLMANLNAHGFLAAGVVMLELVITLWREEKLKSGLWAIALGGALGLFALLTAWQPSDNGFLRPDLARPLAVNFGSFVCEAFVNRIMIASRSLNQGLDAFFGFLVTIFVLRATAKFIWPSPAKWMCLAICGVLVAFATWTYFSPWHSGLLYLFWIFTLWVTWPAGAIRYRAQLKLAFGIVAAAQSVQAVGSGLWDYAHVYSPGAQAARYISSYKAKHPDAHVAAYAFKTFAIQPWLAGNAFSNYHGGAPRPSYVRWNVSEPWKSMATPSMWRKVLDEKPDVIVASLSSLRGSTLLLMPAACRSGYRVSQIFKGQTIWRNGPFEDDSLAIFTKGPSARCEQYLAALKQCVPDPSIPKMPRTGLQNLLSTAPTVCDRKPAKTICGAITARRCAMGSRQADAWLVH